MGIEKCKKLTEKIEKMREFLKIILVGGRALIKKAHNKSISFTFYRWGQSLVGVSEKNWNFLRKCWGQSILFKKV